MLLAAMDVTLDRGWTRVSFPGPWLIMTRIVIHALLGQALEALLGNIGFMMIVCNHTAGFRGKLEMVHERFCSCTST